MAQLAEAIRTGVNTSLLNVHTAFPAIVESFDRAAQTVTVRAAIKRLFIEQSTETTLLVDVPVVQLSCGAYSITMPIQRGDEVLVLVSERCIDNWFEQGGIQPEAEHRMHDLSDGFALIGLNSKPSAIPSYESDGMSIRNRNNDQKITLFSTGAVRMDCPGGLTINGDVQINGEVLTSANVKSAGDHTAGAISLQNHIHGGVQAGPSQTGKPQ